MSKYIVDFQVTAGLNPKCGGKLIREVATKTLQKERVNTPSEVSIFLTTDDEVRRLNAEYRGVNRTTDVLSFSLEEADDSFVRQPEGSRWLGEVVVSYPQAVRQAAEYGHSIERETAFLTVHGILHLLGYDHQDPEGEAIMTRRQEEVLSSLGLTRD